MSNFVLEKLKNPRILKRIFKERLTEPLHMNVLSAFVWAFGGFRARVEWDLVVRQYYAYPMLQAADYAVRHGIRRVTAIEFGVANGAGLMNLARLATQVEAETGVGFDLVGFDSGTGMPPPRDYRDHPELYREGDFPMVDRGTLEAALPSFAKVIYGDVAETVPTFLGDLEHPVAFVSIDVDYYWSTVEALKVFHGPAEAYLPNVLVYLDDVQYLEHNSYCGEYLAVAEFNAADTKRKITPANFLRQKRLFQRAPWIGQIFLCHVLDHASRVAKDRPPVVLSNPYLGLTESLGDEGEIS